MASDRKAGLCYVSDQLYGQLVYVIWMNGMVRGNSLVYRVRHKDLPIENVTSLKNDLVFEDVCNI